MKKTELTIIIEDNGFVTNGLVIDFEQGESLVTVSGHTEHVLKAIGEFFIRISTPSDSTAQIDDRKTQKYGGVF